MGLLIAQVAGVVAGCGAWMLYLLGYMADDKYYNHTRGTRQSWYATLRVVTQAKRYAAIWAGFMLSLGVYVIPLAAAGSGKAAAAFDGLSRQSHRASIGLEVLLALAATTPLFAPVMASFVMLYPVRYARVAFSREWGAYTCEPTDVIRYLRAHTWLWSHFRHQRWSRLPWLRFERPTFY